LERAEERRGQDVASQIVLLTTNRLTCAIVGE
jgi:hypothetical protein